MSPMLGSKMAGPKTQQLLFSNIIRQSIQTSWCFSGFQTTQEKSGCNPKATRLVWFGRMVSPLSPLSGLEPFFPGISSRQPEATKVCKNTTVASFGGPPAANASFDATVQLPVGRCCLWTRLAFGKSTSFGSCRLGWSLGLNTRLARCLFGTSFGHWFLAFKLLWLGLSFLNLSFGFLCFCKLFHGLVLIFFQSLGFILWLPLQWQKVIGMRGWQRQWCLLRCSLVNGCRQGQSLGRHCLHLGHGCGFHHLGHMSIHGFHFLKQLVLGAHSGFSWLVLLDLGLNFAWLVDALCSNQQLGSGPHRNMVLYQIGQALAIPCFWHVLSINGFQNIWWQVLGVFWKHSGMAQPGFWLPHLECICEMLHHLVDASVKWNLASLLDLQPNHQTNGSFLGGFLDTMNS